MENKTFRTQLTASAIGTIWRPKWFLITRFLAVVGVAVTLIVSKTIFHISTIHYTALWKLSVLLFFTNILYVLYYLSGHLRENNGGEILRKRIARFTKVQINIDLIILTLMLHYGGGATNPFILYYFFHTILSSILLSRSWAYIEASVAVILLSGMTALEGYGIIPHYNLFIPGYYSTTIFIFGMIFATTSALYIAVYMATSIMERLRMHQFQLEKSLDEQRRLEEEKSRFLDVVAHDLKSPIATIETMINSILAVHKDNITPEVKKILERIPERTQDLIRFIQDILEFSHIRKIDQLKNKFKPLNFLPIVTATLEMYMEQALDKNIKMTVQSEPNIPSISGSKDHLERMVANLISNAIQYTLDNGSVTVKVTSENDEIVLTVADTGIGIPEHARLDIYNEFFRADNAKKFTHSGTGLGLSITKAIVEQHGGTISFHSEEGEGTAFTVRLPILSR